MKKISTLLLFFFAVQASAQWSQVGTALTGSVRSLYFTDENNGFAVGGNNSNLGYIARTSDGGVNWTSTSYTGTALLRSIFFYTADTGYTCGAGGLVLRTTDGGDSWSTLYTNSSQYFRAVSFVSSQVGFLGGAAGTILRTTDGGINWTSTALGQTTSDIIQLQMLDENTGFAVASSSGFVSGYIYRTTDGGDTWEAVYNDATKGFLALTVIDASTIYAGGYGQTVLRSTDGGDTWESLYTGYAGNSFRSAAHATESQIFLVDDGTGNASNGSIVSSLDGGETWTDTQFTGIIWLCVTFPAPGIGYASNTVGTVYKYECPVPGTPDLSSDPLTVCAGGQLTFSISDLGDVTDYNWSVPDDATIISGEGTTEITVQFGSGSGEVSVHAVNDCGDGPTASASVTVVPNPEPVVTLDAGVLYSSEAEGNQWYFNGNEIAGATEDSYTPTENGDYYVLVTTPEGCTGTSNTVTVIGVGTPEVTVPGFLIAPNPMSEFTQININDPGAVRLIITDVQGRVVLNASIASARTITLNRQQLSEGLYLIRMLNDRNEITGTSKLIVQ
jgi:photosystem II stability/assembly factor-like uncharacterized protein